MKKRFGFSALLLVAVLFFCFAGCGSGTVKQQEAELPQITLETECTAYTVESGTVTAKNTAGEVIWQFDTESYPAAELERIFELGIFDGVYYYVEGGTLKAVDIADGTVLWSNDEYRGASGGCVYDEEKKLLYLYGYYVPDFCAVDTDGNTVKYIEVLDNDYYWASAIAIDGDSINITFYGCDLGGGYEPDGYVFSLNRDTYEITARP